jgi:hypothetical protein
MIDVLAGITLLFPNFLGFYLGIAILLKGLSSMFGIPMGDIGIVIMGVIDIVTGLILLNILFVIPWFWLIIIIKGIYSMLSGLGG